jgi:hypothetical protein
VTSSHNAAEATLAQPDIGSSGLEVVTGSEMEVVSGGLEAVTGGLEAMVDMEALLLQCCQQDVTPTSSNHHAPEATGLKESLIMTPPHLTV